ncbi:hypothetical protein [Arthrobacter glacialis]|uniref:Uncharacterized protein n=1 Tax=Arthrobacter glacialis TaxID=1664 RepID=A0A2S3ZTF8_ARTGL|nr:hypothetical protein [Arthrobacter glacialis]POH72551.1 hypothetical protein CVS27_15650 [Arthrobacter glacialis]
MSNGNEKPEISDDNIILGLQRPDDLIIGGEMTDNFEAQISMGRLSPQGTNTMWDPSDISADRATKSPRHGEHENGGRK